MSRSEPPPVALDVETRGSDFVDFQGRRVTLRGVNLAGGKWPANQPTVKREGFFDAEPSYVGRPFPLADAPSHFRRLRAWGCNVARLTVTWDAIEHAGPGVYDEAYIEYVVEIVRCAGRFGVTVVVDPHQDVWSRYSGGSGAPAWTFAKVGLDVTKFEASGAALVHATRGDPFPRMCWPTNKDKLACFTMFTIFFGGDRFAPDLEIDGEPAQRFLQRHYIAALGTLAAALKDEANVAGFGSMNEPLPGLIGRKRLDRIAGPLRNEHMPTPLEAMALGAGVPRLVREFSVSSLKSLALGAPVGTVSMNEEKTSAWLPGADCVWRAHGIWRVDDRGEPELLKPAYFDVGREYFGDQCMKPFVAAYAEEIRSRGHARWRIFVELPPADLDLCAFPDFSDGRGGPAKLPDGSGGAYVHSPHWYDQLTLFFGRYRPYVAIDAVSGQPAFGRGAVKGLHRRQIAELQGEAAKFGTAPTFVGETGVPFDVDGRAWYAAPVAAAAATPSETPQFAAERALADTVKALEARDVSYALWCYEASHDADELGDGWNAEDLSVYSARPRANYVSLERDPAGVHRGGRATRAVARVFCRRLGGAPTRPPKFKKGVYRLEFTSDATVSAPTEIFVPAAVHYPGGFSVGVSDGAYEVEKAPDAEGGYAIVRYAPGAAAVHRVIVRPADEPPRRGWCPWVCGPPKSPGPVRGASDDRSGTPSDADTLDETAIPLVRKSTGLLGGGV